MGLKTDDLERFTALAKQYGATRLILFGSAATQPDKARDVDLACDGVSGWALYELGARLEETIDLPLDLIPLSPTTPFTEAIESKGVALL